jgi:hypothetical protein
VKSKYIGNISSLSHKPITIDFFQIEGRTENNMNQVTFFTQERRYPRLDESVQRRSRSLDRK